MVIDHPTIWRNSLRGCDMHWWLHYAVTDGHLEVVKLLVEKNAEVDATNTEGLTALHYAAGNGQLEVVNC